MSPADALGSACSAREVLELSVPHDVGLLREQIETYRTEAGGERVMIGVVGEPGAGKSTFAAEIVRIMDGDAVLVPMDGFHLSNRVLERLGSKDRKGAPDTFDRHGFVHLVRRLRQQSEDVVYAPEFLREFDEAIAGAITVHRSTPVVVIEGNYLLLDESPWDEARACLDAVWYIDLDSDVRLARLTERHKAYGRAQQDAWRWAREQDEGNARIIRRTRDRAHLVIAAS